MGNQLDHVISACQEVNNESTNAFSLILVLRALESIALALRGQPHARVGALVSLHVIYTSKTLTVAPTTLNIYVLFLGELYANSHGTTDWDLQHYFESDESLRSILHNKVNGSWDILLII